MPIKKVEKCLENYPLHFVLVANALSIAIYLIGIFVLAKASIILAAAYIIFILFLEFKVLHGSCRQCYYFGKVCCFGKGKISALFFKKEKKNLSEKQVSWKDLIVDFLVSLIPLLVGIYLLIVKFSFFLLALLVLLVLLSSIGNAFVRGNLACKHCKQRIIGCPAEKLFREQNKKSNGK